MTPFFEDFQSSNRRKPEQARLQGVRWLHRAITLCRAAPMRTIETCLQRYTPYSHAHPTASFIIYQHLHDLPGTLSMVVACQSSTLVL